MKEKYFNIGVGILILTYLTFAVVKTCRQNDLLDSNSKDTLGVVVRTETRKRSSDVYYYFYIDGRKYEGNTERNSLKDYVFDSNDTVVVRYYPSNPKINEAIMNIKVKDLKAYYKGDDLIVK